MEKKVKLTFKKFLELWKLGDYKKMYGLAQITWKNNHPKNDLKKLFPNRIKRYSLGDVKQIGEAHFCVKVTVEVKGVKKHLVAHLVCETAPFKPDVKGKWGINPTSVLKNLN